MAMLLQIILSFVTGLCWMADSMEIMILSILSPALHCQWGVSQYNQVGEFKICLQGIFHSLLLVVVGLSHHSGLRGHDVQLAVLGQVGGQVRAAPNAHPGRRIPVLLWNPQCFCAVL